MRNLKRLNRNQIFFLLSLVFVIFCSWRLLAYKKLGYREIPQTTDILDEKNYIWAAKSFLQTGVSTAWSNLDAYEKEKERKDIGLEGLSITFKGEKPSLSNISKFDYPVAAVTEIDVGKGPEQILIVQPFFDHSFVAGLFYGLNTPDDIDSFVQVQPENYRLVAIYVSLLTGFLIFLLTYLIYEDEIVALLSFLIYSAVAVYILVSRYALIENLLIPQTLLSFVFLTLSQKKWGKPYQKLLWVVSGVFAGLALTTKELGMAAVLAGILILLSYRVSRKNLFYFLAPAVLVGSIFYLYALAIAPRLYIRVLQDQAKRGFFGSLNFIHSFYRVHFAGFPLEGWWPFGFVSLAFLAVEFKKHREILVGFCSFLLVFLFFGGLNHPWYWLVFVPFLVIASAIFIRELISNSTVIRIIIFFLFPFSSSLYWGNSVFRDSQANVLIYRAFVLVFLGLITLCHFKKKIPGVKIVLTLALLVILFKMYQWNQYGFTYLIANWGKLPEGFFLKF